jgi:hypothetical protein
MNNKAGEKFDSLYDSFMGLTEDKQTAVVETAQSLLEAQREIELLMENTGAKARQPPGAGEKNSRRILGCGQSQTGG